MESDDLLTFRMRARAVSVKRIAHTRSLGTSNSRLSSVMVPTSTAILSSCKVGNHDDRTTSKR